MGACNISVAVRIRPSQPDATHSPSPARSSYGQFELDEVLDGSSSQQDVYESCASDAVHHFLQGNSAAVVCYGAPETGKTYTFEGSGSTKGGKAGIIPQAVSAVLSNLAVVPKSRYMLTATYSGLSPRQDGTLIDLLAPGAACGATPASQAKLSAIEVTSEDDILMALRRARVLRAMTGGHRGGGAGGRSRSPRGGSAGGAMHAILTLRLTTRPGEADAVSQTLAFVELVSPDLKDAYGLRPARVDEGLQRSLSLAYASLASVLLALRSASGGTHTAPPHVPWRDAPLTRWLQPGLGRARRIALVATVAPGVDAAAETLATLNYISRFRSPGNAAGVLVKPAWQSPVAARRRSASPAAPRQVAAFQGVHSQQSAPLNYASPRAPQQPAERDWCQLTTSAAPASAHVRRPRSAALPPPPPPIHTHVSQTARAPPHAWHDHVPHGGSQGGRTCEWLSPAHGHCPEQHPFSPSPRHPDACAHEPPPPQHDDVRQQNADDAARRERWLQEHAAQRERRCEEAQAILAEVMMAVRKNGGGLREEAQLERLMGALDASDERAGAAEAEAHGAREQLEALQGVVESQAADRAAAVSALHDLQDSLAAAQRQAADAEAQRAFWEGRCEAAAADPGPSFVPVQALVAERDGAAAARAEAERLLRRAEAAENDASAAAARARALADADEAPALRAQLQAAQADAAEAARRERAAAQQAEASGERARGVQERVAALDTRLRETEARLQEALAQSERAREADALRSENAALAARQRGHDAQLAAARAELRAAQSQVAELHGLHDELAGELRRKLELLSAAEAEVAAARAERGAATAATQDSEARCAAAERAARGVQCTVEGLQTQLDAACAAERARATEAETHLEAARRLRGEREQLVAQLAEARGALGAAVGDADGLRSAVDARTALLDRVWADARACLATLGHTTASGRASAAAAAGALHERGGDAGGLQDWAMQLCQERCARAMAEIRAAVAQQHSDLRDAERLRAALAGASAAQRAAEAAAAQTADALRRAEAQLSENAEQLDRAERELTALRRSGEEGRGHVAALRDEAATATAACDTWKAAHATLEARLRERGAEAEARAAEAARLRAAGAQQAEEVEKLRSEASTRAAALEDALRQLDAASARAGSADAAAADAAAAARRAEGRAAEAEAAAARLQAAHDDLAQRLDAKIKDAAAEENRLHAELERLRTQALEGQLRTRQLELDVAAGAQRGEDRERMAAELARLQEERRGHFFAVHELEGKLRKATADADALRHTVERMERDRRCGDEAAAALSATAATTRTIEASFEKLDKARERTRTALQHSRSLRGAASMPGGALRRGSLTGEAVASGGADEAAGGLERSQSNAPGYGSVYRVVDEQRSPAQAKRPGHRRGLSGRVDFEYA